MADAEAAPVPQCPACGAVVDAIATLGADDHRAAPCGCRVGGSTMADLDTDGESTDAETTTDSDNHSDNDGDTS